MLTDANYNSKSNYEVVNLENTTIDAIMDSNNIVEYVEDVVQGVGTGAHPKIRTTNPSPQSSHVFISYKSP